jgi:hypothetical protein
VVGPQTCGNLRKTVSGRAYRIAQLRGCNVAAQAHAPRTECVVQPHHALWSTLHVQASAAAQTWNALGLLVSFGLCRIVWGTYMVVLYAIDTKDVGRGRCAHLHTALCCTCQRAHTA